MDIDRRRLLALSAATAPSAGSSAMAAPAAPRLGVRPRRRPIRSARRQPRRPKPRPAARDRRNRAHARAARDRARRLSRRQHQAASRRAAHRRARRDQALFADGAVAAAGRGRRSRDAVGLVLDGGRRRAAGAARSRPFGKPREHQDRRLRNHGCRRQRHQCRWRVDGEISGTTITDAVDVASTRSTRAGL